MDPLLTNPGSRVREPGRRASPGDSDHAGSPYIGRVPPRAHLVFDADDTLWPTSRYFDQAVQVFAQWMGRKELAALARISLEQIQEAHAGRYGYGVTAFGQALKECVEQTRGRRMNGSEASRIERITQSLATHPVEPFPGVRATLESLAGRHDLLVLTRGTDVDQLRKIEASGLAHLFRRVIVVPEKDRDAYSRLVSGEHLDATTTWMIGNSVRADILPALAAGLGAILVPNEETWVLERGSVDAPRERFMTVRKFDDLALWF